MTAQFELIDEYGPDDVYTTTEGMKTGDALILIGRWLNMGLRAQFWDEDAEMWITKNDALLFVLNYIYRAEPHRLKVPKIEVMYDV